jgi:hypothetical protein
LSLFNEVYIKIIESSKLCSSDKPLSVDIYQKINIKNVKKTDRTFYFMNEKFAENLRFGAAYFYLYLLKVIY